MPLSHPVPRQREAIQRARNLDFERALDPGIEQAVVILIAAGVETFESCEGGPGHRFPEPTVKFSGDRSGYRAVAAALTSSSVSGLRRMEGAGWHPPRPVVGDAGCVPPGKGNGRSAIRRTPGAA